MAQAPPRFPELPADLQNILHASAFEMHVLSCFCTTVYELCLMTHSVKHNQRTHTALTGLLLSIEQTAAKIKTCPLVCSVTHSTDEVERPNPEARRTSLSQRLDECARITAHGPARVKNSKETECFYYQPTPTPDEMMRKPGKVIGELQEV